MKFLFVSLTSLIFLSAALAETTEKFVGKATKNGVLTYVEEHEIKIGEGDNVLEAVTIYKDPSGKIIAEIRSDFRRSLTAPAHEFQDFRFKKKYGVRYEGDDAIMYTVDESGIEKTKKAMAKPSQTLLVGCQGLGYYYRAKMAELKITKSLPILFLVPGDLDTFNFESSYKGKDKDGHEIFEVQIKNWLLRAFAPTLNLTFDGSKNRLLKYEGLSNLYDEKQKQQSVVIDYTWPDFPRDANSN